MTANGLQWLVFGGLTLLMALATAWTVRRMGGRSKDSNREFHEAPRIKKWPQGAGGSSLYTVPPAIRSSGLLTPIAPIPFATCV